MFRCATIMNVKRKNKKIIVGKESWIDGMEKEEKKKENNKIIEPNVDESRVKGGDGHKSYRRRSEERLKLQRQKQTLFLACLILIFIILVLGICLLQVSREHKKMQQQQKIESIQNKKDNSTKEESEKVQTGENQDEVKDDEGEKDTQPGDGEDVQEQEKEKNEKDDGGKGETIERIRTDLDPDKPMIALTFDDGPYPAAGEKILKTLKKYNARATFFVVGNRVPSYHEFLTRVYEQGNEIASHTYSHQLLSKLKPKQIRSEIRKANKIIKQYTGEKPTILRPPYGATNSAVKKVAKEEGMAMICWNVDSEDWSSRDARKIQKKVNAKTVSDGDIILMHELYGSTAKAIKEIVPKMTKKGYQFVTIDELFYYKGDEKKAGQIYYMVK